MKKNLNGLLLVIGSALFMSQSQAHDIPDCATAAAQEFSMPAKLFQAMALAQGWEQCGPDCKLNAEARGTFGPMGLGRPALPEMAKGLGVSTKSLKWDACTNYRAAAWWYMNKAGGNQGDMWVAVTKFYYGKPTHANPHFTNRVKKIYEQL
ncbi:hypothetical protein ACEN2T_18185 [Pseudomonas sp. W22_MBD1_FP4]|uniref:hypothetical protein n=1 Tax=Pseudomonas sp. W22_MBD1_FP4 TaxID=3240272 RepID=UPI003F9A6993